MPFQPTLWPTLITLPLLLALLGLGGWQLERLGWKQVLIAERQRGLDAAPIALPADFKGVTPDLAYRRVRASGVFQHQHELFLGARAYKGIAGLEVLTPLRLDNGDYLLVNRGWVPLALKDPAKRPRSLSQGRVEISGVLRPPQEPSGWFVPRPEPAAKHWFFYRTSAMADHLELPLLPAVVEALPVEGQLPIGREARLELRNFHRQYAITWFALAFALCVIYVVYHRTRARG